MFIRSKKKCSTMFKTGDILYISNTDKLDESNDSQKRKNFQHCENCKYNHRRNVELAGLRQPLSRTHAVRYPPEMIFSVRATERTRSMAGMEKREYETPKLQFEEHLNNAAVVDDSSTAMPYFEDKENVATFASSTTRGEGSRFGAPAPLVSFSTANSDERRHIKKFRGSRSFPTLIVALLTSYFFGIENNIVVGFAVTSRKLQSDMSLAFATSTSLNSQKEHEFTPSTERQINETFSYPHSFWGNPKSQEEIQSFCERAISGCICEVHNVEPPLIALHNFLSQDECNILIDSAMHEGDFQRSTTGSEQETNNIRTSSTAWLRDDDEDSSKSRVLRILADRVASIVGLAPSFQENLQVIQYSETQKFDVHTDHLDEFNHLECKGRLATCLIYLNSSEGGGRQPQTGQCFTGGETYFPDFDVKVSPQQGTSIFFFNTLERPGMSEYSDEMFLNVDLRLRHAGLPVTCGIKWACNRWIHPIQYGAGVRGVSR